MRDRVFLSRAARGLCYADSSHERIQSVLYPSAGGHTRAWVCYAPERDEIVVMFPPPNSELADSEYFGIHEP